MPRGARILLQRVYYHVINRGNQKQLLFLASDDSQKYLELLKHYKRKFGFKIFGYCLMPNHIHLILEPKDPDDLARFMQGLTQAYTMWFNNKYNKVGRLWQERFKSMVITKDSYFLDCVYYVEMNPIRAGIVSSPADYAFSSYKDRVLGNKNFLIDIPDST